MKTVRLLPGPFALRAIPGPFALRAIPGPFALRAILVLFSLASACAAGQSSTDPVCGDGVVEGLETCDDGNEASADGCSAACATEPGYACSGEPSACVRLCGNGVLDPGETCDGGGETALCNTDCTLSVCGDGKVNGAAGEQCDEGGATATCTAQCTVADCGDGVVEGLEACDDAGESAQCNTDCTLSSCGDGKVNATAGEQCDEGGATATCTAGCVLPGCGDGVVGGMEACDDGGESAECNADCTLSSCGDGKVNVTAGEQCDASGESALCDADCTTPSCGDGKVNTTAGEQCDASGESAQCDADCTTVSCGDGTVNTTAGEQCDDGNQASGDGCSATCQNEGGTCESPFTSTYGGDNGWEGNMFDVVALRPLTVTRFDGNFHTGTQDIQIYYRYGTHVGFESTSSAWTLVGEASVQGAGPGLVTAIPITLSVAVSTGQRVAFYVTTQGKTLGTGNVYTNGTAVGNLYAANADLQFFEGTGNYANFAGTFTPRVFNGTIYYTCQ